MLKPKHNSGRMGIEMILLLVVVGLAAGFAGGMVGIGGGIVLIPALVYLFGYSQQQAQGTSLGLLVLPVGILGVINYYKRGFVDYRVILILAIGFVLGSYLGSKVAVNLPQTTVRKIFAILLLVIAVDMLFFNRKG